MSHLSKMRCKAEKLGLLGFFLDVLKNIVNFMMISLCVYDLSKGSQSIIYQIYKCMVCFYMSNPFSTWSYSLQSEMPQLLYQMMCYT